MYKELWQTVLVPEHSEGLGRLVHPKPNEYGHGGAKINTRLWSIIKVILPCCPLLAEIGFSKRLTGYHDIKVGRENTITITVNKQKNPQQ